MIIYKCDGQRFDGLKCTNEYKANDSKDKPDRWLTIEGHIHNGLNDAHCIIKNGLYHFCSAACLEVTLFKCEDKWRNKETKPESNE